MATYPSLPKDRAVQPKIKKNQPPSFKPLSCKPPSFKSLNHRRNLQRMKKCKTQEEWGQDFHLCNPSNRARLPCSGTTKKLAKVFWNSNKCKNNTNSNICWSVHVRETSPQPEHQEDQHGHIDDKQLHHLHPPILN